MIEVLKANNSNAHALVRMYNSSNLISLVKNKNFLSVAELNKDHFSKFCLIKEDDDYKGIIESNINKDILTFNLHLCEMLDSSKLKTVMMKALEFYVIDSKIRKIKVLLLGDELVESLSDFGFMQEYRLKDAHFCKGLFKEEISMFIFFGE